MPNSSPPPSSEPRPTGVPRDVNLTGALMPWKGEHPVLLGIPGSRYLYLPCFTTEAKLRALMGRIAVDFRSIKVVTDETQFLAEIRESASAANLNVKVILDPHFAHNGRVRFAEIVDSAN